MRSLLTFTAIICGTIIACSDAPLWSAPCWILAAAGVIGRR
jgi:hypothetical protein